MLRSHGAKVFKLPDQTLKTIRLEIFSQELKPTLDELGILTPAEMGYDKPELWMPNPYEG